MQAADAQLRSGGNFHFQRAFEAHGATDVVAEGLRNGSSQERGIDRDADEGDVEKTEHHDQDQRGERPQRPEQEPAQRAEEGVRQHHRIIREPRYERAAWGYRPYTVGPHLRAGSSAHRNSMHRGKLTALRFRLAQHVRAFGFPDDHVDVFRQHQAFGLQFCCGFGDFPDIAFVGAVQFL